MVFGSSSTTSTANNSASAMNAATPTKNTSGFGSSNAGSSTGGGFGARTPTAATGTPFGGKSAAAGGGGNGGARGFGGGASNSGGFRSRSPAGANTAAGASPTMGFAASSTATGFGTSSTTATSTFGTPGGMGAGNGGGFGNNRSGNSPVNSAATTPFGSSSTGNTANATTPGFGNNEWVRKDKTPKMDSTAAASATTPAATGGGDEELAALRAKIQLKRKKLLNLKNGETSKKDDLAAKKALAAKNALRFSTNNNNNGNKRKDEEQSKVDLAAKNALRFSTPTGDRDKTLNRLLPSDLKGQSDVGNGNGGFRGAVAVTVAADDNFDVHNAKSLIGTCTSMCPDEELVRREKEGDIQLLEITDPGGLHPKEWTLRNTAVKRFRRSAADFKLDIPELIRPPVVLERVCSYLEEWIMERDRQGPDKRWIQSTQPSDIPPSLDVYQFVWDRTRMIRKDFILQNYIGTGGNCDARAVRCHERIARWHAMCEHQLSHIGDFVLHQSQQNIAELGQTMKTLNNYYDDALGRSLLMEEGEVAANANAITQGCSSDIVMGKSPIDFDGSVLANTPQSEDVSKRIIGNKSNTRNNHGTAEPEMRGLYILLTLNNEGGMEVLKYTARLCVQKPAIFYSKPVQLAMSIFQAKKDHNYARFFNLLRSPSTPYLFACIMFKYVESMRKDALTIMSRTYGAKHKTTGQPFFDSYPLANLVKLLCYEDEDEASTACRRYGLTVEGDQVLWRHSKFSEPRDPEKGHIIPVKPRKMMRTIESKLHGATRLSVCRGGVSGEGATLSGASSGSGDSAAVELDRQKAQEAAEKARKMASKQRLEGEARAKVLAVKLEKERQKQEKVEAEKRARSEAAKRAEMERSEKERIQREKVLTEQRRKEEEVRRLAEAKAAAQRAERERQEREAQERMAARKRAEEEKKEHERQLILAKQREEEARRLAEIKAAKEHAEKERRVQEERRQLAELRREAEEERIRKAKEEEACRIEMMWCQKIEKARKILAWRLWRKQMHKHESLQQSLLCLRSLDPTSTHYPTPLAKEALSTTNHAFHSDSIVNRMDAVEYGLENEVYRLATASRQPIDLSKMVAECLMKSPTHDADYPPTLQSNKNIVLFKLVVLFPKRTPALESFYDTLRLWVGSHLRLGHVSSYTFKKGSQHVEVRAVAVIGNEDSAGCKDCNAALLLLPSASGVSSHVEFPEEVEELLVSDISRMVLVLDDGRSNGINHITETILDDLVGDVQESAQRRGVAAPKLFHFDAAFEKCCETIATSYLQSAVHETQINFHIDPPMARVSLANLGYLCLHRLTQNMDAEGWLISPSFEDSIFSACENTLCLMVDELSHANIEIQQGIQNWPPLEFWEEETNSIPMYFEGQYDLPSKWHFPLTDLKRKVFDIFHGFLEKESFMCYAERFAQKLSPSMRQSLLNTIDNDDISSCFINVLSLSVSGELSVKANDESMLYLPIEGILQIIERAASYEAPSVPEPVLMELPSYLYEKSAHTEEKENSRGENINETPAIDKVANKRKHPKLIELETTGNEGVKRIRSSTPHEETEEQIRSKEFTSFLEALL